MSISSLNNKGLDLAWNKMIEFFLILKETGELESKRGQQRKKWMWQRIQDELIYKLKTDERVGLMVKELEASVIKGVVSASDAGDDILEAFLSNQKKN